MDNLLDANRPPARRNSSYVRFCQSGTTITISASGMARLNRRRKCCARCRSSRNAAGTSPPAWAASAPCSKSSDSRSSFASASMGGARRFARRFTFRACAGLSGRGPHTPTAPTRSRPTNSGKHVQWVSDLRRACGIELHSRLSRSSFTAERVRLSLSSSGLAWISYVSP